MGKALWIPLMLAAAGAAEAATPRLVVYSVDWQETYPTFRVFAGVFNAQGNPVPGLNAEVFKVFENGGTSAIEVDAVNPLEGGKYGASVALVVQASGSMSFVFDDIKKTASGFISQMGEKDQAAVIIYHDSAETISPFSAEKGTVAGSLQKVQTFGRSFLMWDGISAALNLFVGKLPPMKAIVVLGDGRDSGSSQTLDQVVQEAQKKGVPIHAIAHSQIGSDAFKNLEDLATRTGGTYTEAPAVEDLGKGFTRVATVLSKTYVIEYGADDIKRDGEKHRIDVEVSIGGGSGPGLKGAYSFTIDNVTNWRKIIIISAIFLLLIIGGVVIYVVTRPKPPPERICPNCKRVMMPDWDICQFDLKIAKGKLHIQKGGLKGKVYPLVGKIVMIGRGPENAIVLPDPTVSTRHCGISVSDTQFEVVDQGSKSGVYVNGKKVPRRFLRNGDILSIGTTEMKFESVGMADGEGGEEEAAED